MQMKETKFQGVFILDNKLFTKNLTKGKLFQEKIIKQDNQEYRLLDPRQSKLASAITKGIKEIGIKEHDKVLYLGAAHGVTTSYISDIIGNQGLIYAVELSPIVLRGLIKIAEIRNNIAPILADASHPEIYNKYIEQVDVIYQDLAQRNQLQILLKNIKFLKKNGYILFAVKSRSVDVIKNPELIYNEIENELKKHFKIIDKTILDPYHKDHCIFVCKYDSTNNI